MALTTADLSAINTALASGELTIRSADGRTITMRTVDELLKARAAVMAEIASTQASPRVYPRHQLANFSDD